MVLSKFEGVIDLIVKNKHHRRNFPGAKMNFVPKGHPNWFPNGGEKVSQTDRQTYIFVLIIVEINTRSMNLYLASDELLGRRRSRRRSIYQ